MSSFFDLGTKVNLASFPGVTFRVIEEDVHGWIFQVVKVPRYRVSQIELREGDVIYISHSMSILMKVVNDTETTQNDYDTNQLTFADICMCEPEPEPNTPDIGEDNAADASQNEEDTNEAIIPESVLERKIFGGIGAEMVKNMISNAEKDMGL